MRGGLERWKRGAGSQGVRLALDYALRGACDSPLRSTGAAALASYSEIQNAAVTRFVMTDAIVHDELNAAELTHWVDGLDPESAERRGRILSSPSADLILDCTVNAPKSFSIAAMLDTELAAEFEALQDRVRDHILTLWRTELNARRGAGGRFRERLARVEVVELKHRRSRALDPHVHRHLWLSVKVQGLDGRWSNVDSRVAMRVQNLVNAEGDLACRTDPEWIAALANHGYSLNADGEVAELAHVVRPMSRRSNQIEANRAVFLAKWRAEHPGQVPSAAALHRIDRYAWATSRPQKPDVLDEPSWNALVMDELHALDPGLSASRTPLIVEPQVLESLDRDLLARRAVVDADERSKSSNGRFSMLDLRAGATRAVAANGPIAARNNLQNLIDDVVARALSHVRDLLPDDHHKPQHVKTFVTKAFAATKSRLGLDLTALSCGDAADAPIDPRVEGIVDRGHLDAGQIDAAVALASGSRLVTVTGPAGAGKTTLLRAAREALATQRRRLVIVAPTRKAAAVASREVRTPGTSVHALLADHGWRWRTDDAGAVTWWRLSTGQCDPITGHTYSGPSRYALRAGDRVVVDEAGMLDLEAADALTRLVSETGAGLAMIGDPLQASPVGHAGAMALAERRAGRAIVLAEVHRFDDPEYAELTLRLRAPASEEEAAGIAKVLQDRGHIRCVEDADAARRALVQEYFQQRGETRSIAVVVAANEQADQINEAIQDERIARYELHLDRMAVGAGEQRILEGDVVQTRRNDTATGVQNRVLWTVTGIGAAGLELARLDDSTDRRTITRDYAADYLHLAYATTVHGIQGETTDTSLVGPDVDAAGFYVGLTRGRRHNQAIVIASSDTAARRVLTQTMLRGLPEPDQQDAVHAAQQDLAHSARDPEVDTGPGDPPRASDLARVGGWLLAARSLLLAADAARTSKEARQHARASIVEADATDLPTVTYAALQSRIVEAERRELAVLEASPMSAVRQTGSALADPNPPERGIR